MRVPIRRITIVINTNDPFVAEMTLTDFRDTFGKDPDPAQHRIISVELITSPDDQQPMLVSECGRYSRFIKREGNEVYFRKESDN